MSKAERIGSTKAAKRVLKRVADDPGRIIARENLDGAKYHIGVLADSKNTQELIILRNTIDAAIHDIIVGETE